MSNAGGKMRLAAGLMLLVGTQDARTQTSVLQFGHMYPVAEVVTNADNTRAITASIAGDAILWDIATGAVLRRFPEAGTQLVFSPDGKKLAAADKNIVRFWDMEQYEPPRVWRAPHHVRDLTYHPGGKQLAIAVADEPGYAVFDVANLQDTAEEPPVPDPKLYPAGRQVRFSANGKLLGVLHSGQVVVRPWPLQESLSTFDFKDATHGYYTVESFAFSPDSRRIVIGSDVEVDEGDSVAFVWDIETHKLAAKRRCPLQRNFNDIGFMSNGKQIWSSTVPELWTLFSDDKPRQFQTAKDDRGVSAAAISPDGRWLVGGGASGDVYFWDLATGKLVHHQRGRVTEARAVEFSADGQTMLVNLGYSMHARHFDYPNADVLRTASPLEGKRVVDYRLSRNGQLARDHDKPMAGEGKLLPGVQSIVLHDGDGAVSVANLLRRADQSVQPLTKEIRAHNKHQGYLPMATDATGERLLVGTRRSAFWITPNTQPTGAMARGAELYDLRQRTKTQTFITAPTEIISAVSLTPDGSIAATAAKTYGGTIASKVMVLDLKTGATLHQHIERGKGNPQDVAFTRDGGRVLIGFGGQQERATIVWNLKTGEVPHGFAASGPVAIAEDDNHAVIYGRSVTDGFRVELNTGKQLEKFAVEGMVNPGVLDRDHRIMMQDGQNKVQLWDATTGENVGVIRTPGHLKQAVMSADASRIFTYHDRQVKDAWENKVTLWQAEVGSRKYKRIATHEVTSGQLKATNPSGDRFIYQINQTRDEPASTKLYDAMSGETLGEFAEPIPPALQYTPDSKQLIGHPVSYIAGSVIKVYDANSLKEVKQFDFAPWRVCGVSVSANGQRLVVGCDRNLRNQSGETEQNDDEWRGLALGWDAVRLWNANTGEQQQTFAGHRYPVHELRFNQVGNRLLSVSVDRANLWDVATSRALLHFRLAERAYHQQVAGNASLTRLLIEQNNECLLYDAESADLLATWKLPAEWKGLPRCLALSPDGNCAVASCRGGAELAFIAEGQPDPTIVKLQYDSPVMSAVFRPQPLQLATCHQDGTVRLTKPSTGEEIVRFYRFDQGKEWLAITPEGWLDGSPAGLSLLGWRDAEGKILHWYDITRRKQSRTVSDRITPKK